MSKQLFENLNTRERWTVVGAGVLAAAGIGIGGYFHSQAESTGEHIQAAATTAVIEVSAAALCLAIPGSRQDELERQQALQPNQQFDN